MKHPPPSRILRFKASNALGIRVILFGSLVPIGAWWFIDSTQRTVSSLVAGGLTFIGLSFVYLTSYELNKVSGQFSMRRINLLGIKSLVFPLSEIKNISVKQRYFTGGYRSGNNRAFRLTLTKKAVKK